jgi:hypothetical protein
LVARRDYHAFLATPIIRQVLTVVVPECDRVAPVLTKPMRPGLHSLQAGTIREQARFLNMLRFLGNELRVPLVCVGTAQARNALRNDDQLVRRFEVFALPPWRDGEDVIGLISTLQRTLPLRRESQIDEKMLTRILSVTGGITSSIFSVMSQLVIAAIESAEERIVPSDVSSAGKLQAVLGEPV